MEVLENQEETRQSNNKGSIFMKKHKKLLLMGLSAIVAIILVCTLPNVINNAILTSHVQSYLDGKMFIVRDDNLASVYAFSKNTMARESWYAPNKSSHGDMNRKLKYKVEGSLGSKEVRLWYKEDGKWWNSLIDFKIGEDGTVDLCDEEWELSTLDEINIVRKEMLCEHEFDQDIIIKIATCASEGEISHKCKKCGYIETQTLDALEHSYKNKICTECGAKKQPRKAYDIEANTWYTYQDILHFQNIKILSAFSVSQGKGMSVSYNFVCQHCHVIDEVYRTNIPEFNYAINKIFTCEECGGLTTVKIELN